MEADKAKNEGWSLPISPQAFEKEILEHKLRSGISKYDLIKVKILSGTGDSYSFLSRLIIYKMLTCIGVGYLLIRLTSLKLASWQRQSRNRW